MVSNCRPMKPRAPVLLVAWLRFIIGCFCMIGAFAVALAIFTGQAMAQSNLLKQFPCGVLPVVGIN
jgi:hypothetical protein